MFLNPTAKPTPRLDALAAGRVAGPAGQADRVARQRLPARARAAPRPRRITSATGSEPLDHLPGRQRVAGPSAFSSRSSTGSIPSVGRELVHLRLGGEAASARRRSRASRRRAGCSCRRRSTRSARSSTLYGPIAKQAAFEVDGGRAGGVGAAVEQDPHAGRRRACPSRVARCSPRSAPGAGGRGRRTTPRGCRRSSPAGSVCRASSAPWICIERSSRPPNAPPTPARWIRTCSGVEPEARRDLVAVDVQPLRRDVDVDAALAVGNREPRLRPEERLVLDAELVDAADRDVARRRRDRRGGSTIERRRRSAAGPRGSRGRRSARRDAAAPARSRAPCRRPARAARTRRATARRRGAPAPDARPRRARPARRSSARGRPRAPAGRRTRARRSSAPGTSSCVSTAWTPGIAHRLRDVELDDLACACGLRSVWPQSIPAATRSLE